MRGLHIVLTAAVIVGSAEAGRADAKLSVPATDFAFGYVPQNAKIAHRYTLKSVGTDTLKIERIQPGCGCTQAPFLKSALAPGDSTDGELIFNTGSYSGNVAKVATVKTNPPGVPETQLKFTANVLIAPDSIKPVRIKPFIVDLTNGGSAATGEMTITISNVSTSDLVATLVGSPSNLLKVTLPKVIRAGKSAEAKVALTKEAGPVSFESSVTLQFNDEASSRYTVPVKHLVQATTAVGTTPSMPAGH